MNKNIKALVIGFGSAGQNHCRALIKIIGKDNIFIFSKNKKHNYNKVKVLNENLNTFIDYVIISNITSKHYETLKVVDKIFKKKKILIEKPFGMRATKNKFNNNYYFIGYNLRYHPLMIKLKSLLIRKKVYNINISCLSYLPDWRLSQRSYSHSKIKGGGVEYDLSHEIDYLLWIFGDISNFEILRKKLSSITKDSNDLCNITGTLNSGANFQITLSYLSRINQRKLLIDTKSHSFSLDLLKNKLIIKSNDKDNIYSLPSFKIANTFGLMHNDLLSKKHKINLPNIAFNNKLQNVINKR